MTGAQPKYLIDFVRSRLTAVMLRYQFAIRASSHASTPGHFS